MNKKLFGRISVPSQPGRLVALLLMVLLIPTSSASALSQTQQNLYAEGIYYFDAERDSTDCSAQVPAGTLPSVVPEPYNGDFTSAGKAYNVAPALLAALFTEENFTGQTTAQVTTSWKNIKQKYPDPNKGWPTSPDDAQGPFQFIPPTWASLGVDADHNGTKDVNNLLDAAYGAANYAKTDGATADKPKSVWVNFADGYSGHTGGYGDMVSKYIDFYSSGASSTSTSSSSGSTSSFGVDCGGAGAVAGNIVQTALNFAWEDYPQGHNFNSIGESEAKPAYVQAVKKYETNAGSNPAGFTTNYSDCGAFVATVMQASGVDPNYAQLGTSTQLAYVKSKPDKYIVKNPGQWTVADVQPGDIFIADGHTYIYVGKQSNGYSVAEASQGDHVPEVDAVPYPSQGSEQFSLVRIKS